jgi:hypothetical protein
MSSRSHRSSSKQQIMSVPFFKFRVAPHSGWHPSHGTLTAYSPLFRTKTKKPKALFGILSLLSQTFHCECVSLSSKPSFKPTADYTVTNPATFLMPIMPMCVGPLQLTREYGLFQHDIDEAVAGLNFNGCEATELVIGGSEHPPPLIVKRCDGPASGKYCRVAAMFMCSKCQQAHYCGTACQIAAWKTHKVVCRQSSGAASSASGE